MGCSCSASARINPQLSAARIDPQLSAGGGARRIDPNRFSGFVVTADLLLWETAEAVGSSLCLWTPH